MNRHREEGYTVHQVANVVHKTTKNKLPIFFIDIEPSETNKEIYNLTSLLHIRVKIKQPDKRKDIVQFLKIIDKIQNMDTPGSTMPIHRDAFAVKNIIHQPAA